MFFVVVVSLQLEPVQQFMAGRVTAFLSSKLNTKVSVGHFTTDWSNSIVLKEFYLEDQHQDTLLYAGRLGLDLKLLALLRNKVILKSARLENGIVNIWRTMPDSAANYDFIVEAFDGKATKPNDPATAFALRLGGVRLMNVKVKVNDEVKGTLVNARIGKFRATMQRFDSENKIYKIRKAALSDSYFSLVKTKASETKTDTILPDFSFKNIAVQNVFLKYHHQPEALKLAVRIGTSDIKADVFDTQTKLVNLRRVVLANSAVAFYHRQAAEPETETAVPATAGATIRKALFSQLGDWKITLEKVALAQVSFRSGNGIKKVSSAKIDFSQLNLTGINLVLQNVVLDKQRLTAEIDGLKLKEKSGFKVVNLKGKVKADNKQLQLRNLNLTTGASKLQTSVTLQLPKTTSISATTKPNPNLTADIKKASIGPEDLKYFTTKPPFQKIRKHPFKVKGQVSGSLDNLNTQNITIEGLDGTNIAFSGNIRNLTSAGNKEFTVQFKEFTTTRQDLVTMLPAGTIPKTLTLPETVTISGGVASKPGIVVLKNLRIGTSDGTTLLTSGTISGQAGSPDRRLDLEIKKLVTTRAALQKMLPKGALAPEIQLPDNITYAGKLNGSSLKNFASDGAFETSFGNFYINLNLQTGQLFQGSISLKDFDIGKLLKLEKTLGKGTGVANFKGQGYKVNTMVLHFDARIKKLQYEKEVFRNIELKGTLDKNVYAVKGDLHNIVLQGLGHTLKKLKPKNLGVKKIWKGLKKDR